MASKTIIIGTFVLVVVLGVFGGGVATGILIGGNDSGDLQNATANIPGSNDSDEGPGEVETDSGDESDDSDEESGDNDTTRNIPARDFNDRNISEYLIEYINIARVNGSANITTESMNTTANLTTGGGLAPLRTETTNAGRLTDMAGSHSDTMAREGRVAHRINNISTPDRYKQYNLYQRCEVNVDNNYVLSPRSDRYEVIGKTVAGQEYTPSDTLAGWDREPNSTDSNETDTNQTRIQFNANDRQVARALAIHWLDGASKSSPILHEDMQEIGVGVTVTRTGNVYATVNTCGE